MTKTMLALFILVAIGAVATAQESSPSGFQEFFSPGALRKG